MGERRDFTGETAAASGTGEEEMGVVLGVLLPLVFCGWVGGRDVLGYSRLVPHTQLAS